MIVETLLSSIEESRSRLTSPSNTPCAINYCPFCSSSFIRIETIEKSGDNRYRCGDCDMTWTMIDPST
jgi:transposase-like protein